MALLLGFILAALLLWKGKATFISAWRQGLVGLHLIQSRVIDEILYFMLHSLCIPDEARVALFLPLCS